MKVYKLILIIIWMVIIFMFSNQSATESSKVSDGLIDNTIVKIYELFNGKVSEENKEKIIDNYTVIVRKSAHFVMYFILGVLCFVYFKDFTKHYIIYSILLCFLYAVSDEIHQMFSINRGPGVIDVLIDTFGGVTAIAILGRKIIYDYFKKA